MRYVKLATIALLGVMLVAGVGCMNRDKALYEQDRGRIQDAVSEYMCRPMYDGYWGPEVPVIDFNTSYNVSGEEVIPKDEYHVIAICALLTRSFRTGILIGILKEVPASCEALNCEYIGENARFDVPKCNCTGHYRWLTTPTGDIASICIGAECEAHGEDGYQGVYP